MKVIWLDNDKKIPKHGIAKKDQEKDLPEDIAKEFIKKGQAKKPKLKGSK